MRRSARIGQGDVSPFARRNDKVCVYPNKRLQVPAREIAKICRPPALYKKTLTLRLRRRQREIRILICHNTNTFRVNAIVHRLVVYPSTPLSVKAIYTTMARRIGPPPFNFAAHACPIAGCFPFPSCRSVHFRRAMWLTPLLKPPSNRDTIKTALFCLCRARPSSAHPSGGAPLFFWRKICGNS